ncbi:hypothetical protein TNCV_2587211 [Trichonephila clavipes]|nr:hypothetical protein TNCV_2587211 [Trichonephila clavipes]
MISQYYISVVWKRFPSGGRVVRVPNHGWPCHEFEPSTTKDPPCREAMHVKSVESSNVLPLMWCGKECSSTGITFDCIVQPSKAEACVATDDIEDFNHAIEND